MIRSCRLPEHMRRLGVQINRFSSSGNKTSVNVKSVDEIPGPYVFPLLHNFPQFLYEAMNKEKILQIHSDMFKKHGKIWKYKMGSVYLVNLHEPRDYEKVFRAEGRNPNSSILILWPFKEYFDRLGLSDSNLLTARGEEWRSVRIPMQTEIFSVDASRSYADLLIPIVEDAVSKLAEGGDEVNEVYTRFTLEGMGAVLFNKRLGSLDRTPNLRLISAVQNVLSCCEKLMAVPFQGLSKFLFWKKFEENMNILFEEGDRYVREIEEDLNKSPESEEFKAAAQSYSGKNLLSDNLTRTQIHTNLITFLFAGVDTTSVSLKWLLINLARNPDVQEKLFQEFSSRLQGRTLCTKDLKEFEFSFFRATLKESFRVTPTFGAVVRFFNDDIELNGYNIPKNSLVFYTPFPILQDPKRLANPEKFDPERWLAKANKADKSDGVHSVYAQVQFGFGPRSCLGAKLATIEMMMFCSRLLQDYKIELDPPNQKWNAVRNLSLYPVPMPNFKLTPRQQ
jgi:cytochrome P450